MTTRKIHLAITYTLEIEVDDRVIREDVAWTLGRILEICDGRQDFCVEMLEAGVSDVGASFARNVHVTLGYRLARRYPGLHGREWTLADKFSPAKVHYRPRRQVTVRDGDNLQEYDE